MCWFFFISRSAITRPSDRVRLKNANCANWADIIRNANYAINIVNYAIFF